MNMDNKIKVIEKWTNLPMYDVCRMISNAYYECGRYAADAKSGLAAIPLGLPCF